MSAALNCPDDTTEIKSQFLNGEIDDEEPTARNQAECLQGICPDDCLYTAFYGCIFILNAIYPDSLSLYFYIKLKQKYY